MEYELIKKHSTSRLYKFSTPINKNKHGKVFGDPTEYVIVSDAHTHIERLVFPVYLIEGYVHADVLSEQRCLKIDYLDIAGEMTMMIEGGDPNTLLEDEEYLEQLIAMNKVS